MSDISQSNAEANAARWADYLQIVRDNPVIEPSHQVNLGAMASRYGVDIDVADLDTAIANVNTGYNVQPPIRRLGSISLEGGAHEIHHTTAKGVDKTHVWFALRGIAVQKLLAQRH